MYVKSMRVAALGVALFLFFNYAAGASLNALPTDKDSNSLAPAARSISGCDANLEDCKDDKEETELARSIVDQFDFVWSENSSSASDRSDVEEVEGRKKKLKKKKLKILAVVLLFAKLVKKVLGAIVTFKLFALAKAAFVLSVAAVIGLIVVLMKGREEGGGGGGGLFGGNGGGGSYKKPEHGGGGSAWGASQDSYEPAHNGYARLIDVTLPKRLSEPEH